MSSAVGAIVAGAVRRPAAAQTTRALAAATSTRKLSPAASSVSVASTSAASTPVASKPAASAATVPRAAAVNPDVATALSAYAAGSLTKAVTIQDSAAHIAARFGDLKAMAAAGRIASIKLTDAAKPTLSVSVADATGSSSLVALLSGASVQVSDTAAHVQGGLDALQSVAAKLAAIEVQAASDGSRPTVIFNATQYKNAAAAIAKLKGAATALQLSGNLADYRVTTKADGSIALADRLSRPNESTTVKGVNTFVFHDVTTFADTGNAQVNALLSGATNQWWIDGSGSSVAGAAIAPGLYGLSAAASRHTLTWSFMGDTPPAGATAADRAGYTAMNATQKQAVRDAFAYLSGLVNVTFQESSVSDGSADINFGMNTQSASAGYATPPHASGSHNVFVMLAANQPTNASFAQGSYGWETLIHEIGHAMGLKHPGNYNAGGGGTAAPWLAGTLDSRRYSIMSYNQPADGSFVTATQTAGGTSYSASPVNPSTYMPYDIAALQMLYGAATDSNRAASAAHFQTLTFDSNWRGFETLWTPNGGTLDASATQKSAIIDLRAGAFSSIGATVNTASYLASFPKAVQSFASKNATFFGFNDVALAYGSSIGTAKGGSANDAFFAATQSATIDGGSGTDVVYLSGQRADWTVNGNAIAGTANKDGSLTISGELVFGNAALGYSVSVANVERLKFYQAATAAVTHSAVDLMA